eukprot:CAMPEP_0171235832 /NCGR_PEP_ID=MMETSP0790-20130122/42142_1 /TAXON_ID=2925 /ORGANISM="Alexandrium catenella, Strain OF101" /LENGTH=415 /DNA_ID=CAMNT_0011702141 /DNA_START=40 /DNA_END=1284 /DNA_ORIENTATION=+
MVSLSGFALLLVAAVVQGATAFRFDHSRRASRGPVLQCDASAAAETKRVPFCTAADTARMEADIGRLLSLGNDHYSEHWRGKGGFPVSRNSISNASAPYGHKGALHRLQTVAARLISREPVEIVVFGGSVTAGHLCNTSWPKRVQELFSDLGYPVTVKNVARPATTSKFAVAHMSTFQPAVDQADLAIVDYTANDRTVDWRWDSGSYTGGAHEVQAAFKELTSVLITAPQKPAVLALETIETVSQAPKCAPGTDIRALPHWAVEEELLIPVVDYTTAVCPSGSLNWFRGPNEEFDLHPGEFTHDVIARIIAVSLLQQAAGVCATPISQVDHPKGVRPDGTTECLLNPVTLYSVTSVRKGVGAFAPVAHDPTWRFEEDVAGKPGWIARASEPAGEISFTIGTKVGWLQVEFLATYE